MYKYLFFHKEEANSFIFVLLYFDIKTNFYGKFRHSLRFISKRIYMKKKNPLLSAFRIFVKAVAVAKADKHDYKKSQDEYNYMSKITENNDSDTNGILHNLYLACFLDCVML